MKLHYNADYGYIICAETRMENTPMRVVIDLVTVLKSTSSATELGEAILKSIEQSRTAKPIRREEVGNYRYWHITGITSFAAFSRKFQCVSIQERGFVLEVFKLFRDSDGSYAYPAEQPPLKLPTNISAADLGAEIISLFSSGIETPTNEMLSFETVHGSVVTCHRPLDTFLDCGDGHTDAYQVFALEDAPENRIAFLVDSGYSELSEAAIKKKWQEQYGELSEFYFQPTGAHPLLLKIDGKTAFANIISYLYQDGDGTMEVIASIDLRQPQETQGKVKVEFEMIVSSILIVPYS